MRYGERVAHLVRLAVGVFVGNRLARNAWVSAHRGADLETGSAGFTIFADMFGSGYSAGGDNWYFRFLGGRLDPGKIVSAEMLAGESSIRSGQ